MVLTFWNSNKLRLSSLSLLIGLKWISSCDISQAATGIEFTGTIHRVIELEGDKSTGLNSIYVAYNGNEISSIRISGVNSSTATLEKYSNLGGGYAMDVPTNRKDGVLIVENPEANMGYILRDADTSYCFWIVDYQSFGELVLNSIADSMESDCAQTVLEAKGSGDPIIYYTIDGRRKILSRGIDLSYNILEWDQEKEMFTMNPKDEILESLTPTITIIPPLYASTSFDISGDRFLKEWNMMAALQSKLIEPSGITVMTKAIQINSNDTEDESNEIKTESSGLGGSAPAVISFQSYVSDAVMHSEWQIASDPEFEYIILRYNEQDIEYTFMEEGTYYVRFIGSNADGSCEAVGDTYTISIGASDLRIPNAFSPNGDGVNDIWKVGYRSITEFKCWIYDSIGNQLFYFDDPADGWDGKRGGKYVKPGVYYYVIQAAGADGKKYKKSGDINIVGYKKAGNNSTD